MDEKKYVRPFVSMKQILKSLLTITRGYGPPGGNGP